MNQDQWKLSVVFKWIHKPSNRFIASTFIYFNLSNWFPCNKLAFNLKKGKSVTLFSTGDRSNICFKTAKSSFRSVSGSPKQCYCMTCYKYLGEHLDRTVHFEMHFPKFSRRQQEEWTSYGTSVPALMLLAPNKFINQWLQYANIKPIAAWMVRALQLLDSLHWDPKPQNHFLQMQSAGLWP